MSFKKTSLKKCETTLIAPYRNDLNDIAAEIADEFLTATQILVHGTLEQNPRADASVFLGDARHLQQVLPRSDYSVVITSPPYPNRMSYIRELRPYMYWTGFLRTGREAGEMDWEAIGGTWGCATSLLSQWSPMVEAFSPCHEFYKTIASVEARQPILSRYLHKYFCDVRQHISELKTVLRRGAKCFYVVGNSKFYNTMIPTEEYYADIFRSEGFVDVAVSPLRKRTSKKELFEYVVSARWE